MKSIPSFFPRKRRKLVLRSLNLETLEPRFAPSTVFSLWTEMGPGPSQNAQVDIPPNDDVVGAIQSIAVHPTDPNTVYIGAVNGGVWKTTDGGTNWEPLTDDLPSQSIGDVVFDSSDATNNTLVVGTGRWSNFANRGDDEVGLYRTTDGGTSWSQINSAEVSGKQISSVVANGSTLLVGTINDGLWLSTNTGGAWTDISDGGASHLPDNAGVADLVVDPADDNRIYAAVRGSGIWTSADGGTTWSNVTGTISTVTGTGTMRLAMHNSVGNNVLFVATVNNAGVLNGVWFSNNQGGAWTQMDTPVFHPGGQGFNNTAIAADPTDPDLVYLGGDRITAWPFTGNVLRGDRSLGAGTQFTAIVDAGANSTAPHADARAMAFLPDGRLLESDDGGIYVLADPSGTLPATTQWSSFNGDLGVAEAHDVAYDSVANVYIAGLQDNCTAVQTTAGSKTWDNIHAGDGGDVAIDNTSLAGAGTYRYVSSQNLGSFTRYQYDNTGTYVGELAIATGVGDAQFVTPIELNAANAARFLIGGSGDLYESTNINTGAPTFTNIGGPGANRNAMVYGVAGNPDLIYVGSGSGVWARTTAGGAINLTTALPAGAGTITDVAVDPDDWQHVFAVDNDQVFESTNAGGAWTDITGNLTAISSADFRTIEYIPGAARDALTVGTRSGVFAAPGTDTDNWTEFGTALPDVLVFDLEYNATDNILAAGTLGRGVWSFAGANTVFEDVVIAGTGGNDTIVINATPGGGTYSVNGGPAVAFGSLPAFTFNGGAGDDVFTLNFTGGNPIPTGGLFFNGGVAGSDSLQILAGTFGKTT